MLAKPAVLNDEPIRTPRLDLHTVWPDEYELLVSDPADPRLWVTRGFTNPAGHLVRDLGPLPHRIPRVRQNPAAAPYLLRLAVLRSEAAIVGSAGFHDLPDDAGMIEIGVGLEPAYRGQGLAQELLHGMWGWVLQQPGVRTLRYTVSASNLPSVAIIRKLQFRLVGQQWDEDDGAEDIYELAATEYLKRFAAQ